MAENEIFNPIITGTKSDAQIDAEKTAKDLADRFSGEGMKVINELILEIQKAQLASRFKGEISDILFEQIICGSQLKISKNGEIALKCNGTVGFKKFQLESDLLRIQSDLLSLSDRLKSVIMDIKASQID